MIKLSSYIKRNIKPHYYRKEALKDITIKKIGD
jgi:hypothetical protein